jgi:hypothetical protein
VNKESPNQQQYRNSIAVMLANPTTRLFFWRLIVEDCKVFEEGYPMNASAYSLLAVQSLGKRLLADAKAVDPKAVYEAEQEYNRLMEISSEFHNTKGDE